jgi:hypothetical protein
VRGHEKKYEHGFRFSLIVFVSQLSFGLEITDGLSLKTSTSFLAASPLFILISKDVYGVVGDSSGLSK